MRDHLGRHASHVRTDARRGRARRAIVMAVAAVLAASWACRGARPGAAASDAGGRVLDSARAADRAIAALGPMRAGADSLASYQVYAVTRDSAGYLFSIVREVRPQYARTIAVAGGGGLVRVWWGDSAAVLRRYR